MIGASCFATVLSDIDLFHDANMTVEVDLLAKLIELEYSGMTLWNVWITGLEGKGNF